MRLILGGRVTNIQSLYPPPPKKKKNFGRWRAGKAVGGIKKRLPVIQPAVAVWIFSDIAVANAVNFSLLTITHAITRYLQCSPMNYSPGIIPFRRKVSRPILDFSEPQTRSAQTPRSDLLSNGILVPIRCDRSLQRDLFCVCSSCVFNFHGNNYPDVRRIFSSC